MPRQPRTTSRRAGRSSGSAWFHDATAGLLARIDEVVGELDALRAENARLRGEVEDATVLIGRIDEALTRMGPGDGRRRGRAAAPAAATPPRRSRAGRVTPESVTPEVVRSVISRLGSPSAAEIAAELRRGGQEVSGRAVRFIAEKSGARAMVDEGGTRRYSV